MGELTDLSSSRTHAGTGELIKNNNDYYYQRARNSAILPRQHSKLRNSRPKGFLFPNLEIITWAKDADGRPLPRVE